MTMWVLITCLLQPGLARAEPAPPSRAPLRIAQAAFAAMQAADVASTWHALDRGALEANPLLAHSRLEGA